MFSEMKNVAPPPYPAAAALARGFVPRAAEILKAAFGRLFYFSLRDVMGAAVVGRGDGGALRWCAI